MKSLFATLILAFASTSAVAEWHRLFVENRNTYYFDPTTVSYDENKFKVLILIDFNKVQDDGKDGFASIETLREFDCKEKQLRTLAYISHSMNMGTGNMVSANSDADKWMPIPSGRLNATLLEILCEKK